MGVKKSIYNLFFICPLIYILTKTFNHLKIKKNVVSVTFIIMYNVYLYKPFNMLTVFMKIKNENDYFKI